MDYHSTWSEVPTGMARIDNYRPIGPDDVEDRMEAPDVAGC
jgi:hypothetical protein